jgi:hypothetical protein
VSVVLAIGARLAEQRRREQQEREQQEREAVSGWQGCLFIADPEAEAGQ